jgi:hypothetical protein
MLAQVAGAGRRAGIWLGSFGRRPLALSSPYPVAECLQGLAAVTTSRGRASWYLDPRTAMRSDHLFKGELYQSRTRLARFPPTGGRESFDAMLEVRLDPQAGGGTALSGWVGKPGGTFAAVMFTALGCLVSLGLLVAGIIQLALGHIIGLAPALAFPLPGAFIAWSFAYGRRRSLESGIAELVQEVNEVLGSTAEW